MEQFLRTGRQALEKLTLWRVTSTLKMKKEFSYPILKMHRKTIVLDLYKDVHWTFAIYLTIPNCEKTGSCHSVYLSYNYTTKRSTTC